MKFSVVRRARMILLPTFTQDCPAMNRLQVRVCAPQSSCPLRCPLIPAVYLSATTVQLLKTSSRLFHSSPRAENGPLITGLVVAGGALAAKYIAQVGAHRTLSGSIPRVLCLPSRLCLQR